MALLKLGLLTQEQVYTHSAVTILRALRPAMSRYPSAFGYMLSAMDFYLSEPKEIAIVGKIGSHEVRSFGEEIYRRYLPNKVVAACEPGDEAAASEIKLLAGKTSTDSKATAYVCRDYTCLAPSTSVEELAAQLE